ncbi:MAG: winged helix-turn-helix transcriptional regulator [Chlamydiia bacterium]|nr:winged helix-turn-helix transcriptional regulator [Chlamydiia bacterium]
MKSIDWNGAAECLRLLSHPHRLQLIALLLEQDYSVGELAGACGVLQNVISEHLNLMKHKGFVTSSRKKRRVYYSINEPMLGLIIKCIKGRFSNS